MNNNIAHNNLCQSVKNKNNTNIQCQNKAKKNEIFCGIHLNCKNIVLFAVNNINNTNISNTNISNTNISNTSINNSNITYNNDTNNLINNLNSIDLDSIENVIHNSINEFVTENNTTNLINTVSNFVSNFSININSNNQKEITIDTYPDKEKDEIFDKDKLYENILNDTFMSIYSIRKSIKKSKLNLLIDTKNSKSRLIESLKNLISKERYYLSNEASLIKIQSFFRKWLVYRKKICNNDSDILTFIDKYDIPDKYFYLFNDKITNKKYAYDIRTLLEIIKSDYPSCPYTFRQFTENEKNFIFNYCNKLSLNGINVNLEKIKMSPEEEIEMKIKDIFHKINMLDNYTDHLWFKNLSLHQLIDLYIKSEDIWNYRSNMTIESKKKIIQNGIAFRIPLQIIKTYKSKSKMQHILLDEYTRFVTEGINRDEKKLGAILVLTGLVEVSFEAAQALPHLIQI